MTTLLPVSPTPYITPGLLLQAPTGVDWSSIPPGGIRSGVTSAMNRAEISNICARATAMVDKTCRQPLRATVDTLPLYGPGVRVGVPRGCSEKPVTLIMTRWPVLEVLSVQYSRNVLPAVWSTVPAGLAVPAYPPSGIYGSSAPAAAGEGGQSVRLAAGYVDWRYGREGFAVLVEYVNGWPHCGLTTAASPVLSGPQTIQVDDCTGWVITPAFPGGASGATGTVYDAAAQEVIQVTAASAVSGPGTLTLAAPLLYEHAAGALVSTLPQSVGWAAILYACDIALERGATATGISEVPGRAIAAAAGQGGKGTPSSWADCILKGTFDRII